MAELPRQSYVTVRYYAPWLTLVFALGGFAALAGAVVWASPDIWPVLLAFAGGGFSSVALGRAALGEEETR
jgi:hypothetical protein